MPKISRSFLVVAVFSWLLASCAENLPRDIPSNYTAPVEHIFAVALETAWKGTVQAVSSDNLIKTLDRDSGLIVTEYGAINKRALNIFETLFFGRTYKNSYSINLSEVAPGKTRIRVQSNLMMEQFAVYNRERQVEWFEAYMRQDLFRRICLVLNGDEIKCASLFPDYNSAACVPAPPEPMMAMAAKEPPPAKATLLVDPSVKEVQKALQAKGYPPGPVDGILGKRTRAALLRFQEENGLEGGGYLTEATMRALGL